MGEAIVGELERLAAKQYSTATDVRMGLRIISRYQGRLREWEAAAAAYFGGSIKRIGLAWIAIRRKRVIHAVVVTHRHFGSGIEIGTPRNDDNRRAAVGIMDDRARRLDDRATRRPEHDRLMLFRLRCRVGGACDGQNNAAGD